MDWASFGCKSQTAATPRIVAHRFATRLTAPPRSAVRRRATLRSARHRGLLREPAQPTTEHCSLVGCPTTTLRATEPRSATHRSARQRGPGQLGLHHTTCCRCMSRAGEHQRSAPHRSAALRAASPRIARHRGALRGSAPNLITVTRQGAWQCRWFMLGSSGTRARTTPQINDHHHPQAAPCTAR